MYKNKITLFTNLLWVFILNAVNDKLNINSLKSKKKKYANCSLNLILINLYKLKKINSIQQRNFDYNCKILIVNQLN